MSPERAIEEKLAAQQNKNLQGVLIGKRRKFIALAVAFFLLAIGVAFTGFWMISLASIVLGLIFLSLYFDANGHLHEVQRRSTRSLVRDFSVLRDPDLDSSNSHRPAPH